MLLLWEKRNTEVKTFDCRFKRWTYDTVFGRADQPKFIDIGSIKYAAPDRGMFRTDTTIDKNGREAPIEDTRAEHWISDGKSIIEYNHLKHQMIEHKLPPEAQGKAIADTPLPFLFGADAKKLRQRYFLHLVTPADVKGEIWLEAFPRFQQDAASFHQAQLHHHHARDEAPRPETDSTQRERLRGLRVLRCRGQRSVAIVPRQSVPGVAAVGLAVDRRGSPRAPKPAASPTTAGDRALRKRRRGNVQQPGANSSRKVRKSAITFRELLAPGYSCPVLHFLRSTILKSAWEVRRCFDASLASLRFCC